MTKTIYTIFDNVARVYSSPFFCLNHEEAKRTVSNAVNSPGDHDLFLHPSDFSLFCIGSFDDSVEGDLLIPLQPIDFICRCDSLTSGASHESIQQA